MDKNNKFKMVASAILNFIYCSQLVYYCTYLHIFARNLASVLRWRSYMTYAKILNKNKIQDGGGRHIGFLQKQQ